MPATTEAVGKKLALNFLPSLTKPKLIGAILGLAASAVTGVIFAEKINYKYLFGLLAVVLVSGAAYLWVQRPQHNLLLVKLHAFWQKHFSEQHPGFASADYLRVNIPSDNRSSVIATEFIAETTPASVIWFFPGTEGEKDHTLNRIVRGYAGRLLNPATTVMGLSRRVPLKVRASSSPHAAEAIRQEIATQLKEPRDSEMVTSLFELFKRNELSALLLVDAMDMSAVGLKAWLDWPKHNWIPKCVIAARVDTAAEIKRTAPVEFAFVESSQIATGAPLPELLEAEFVTQAGMIDQRAQATDTTGTRDKIRSLALAFLKLTLEKPGQIYYSEREIGVHWRRASSFLDLLPAWIESRPERAIKYFAWRRERQPMRDMLVALELMDGENLRAELRQSINDSPSCPYVRPILDYFIQRDGGSTHVLSERALTAIHKLIKAAWERPATVSATLLTYADEAIKVTPPLVLDPRDIAALIPGFARAEALGKYSELFLQVPYKLRAQMILENELSETELASSLDLLLTDRELWMFFEDGAHPSPNIVSVLSKLPDRKTLIRYLMLMILAPHGPYPPDSAAPLLEHAARWQPDLWKFGDLPPLPSDDLALIARRIRDVALQMSDSGRAWVGALRESHHIFENADSFLTG